LRASPTGRPARVSVALIVIVLGAAAFAWTYRAPLFTWATIRLLEYQGLGPARFIVDDVGLHQLRAHDVSLRGGAIAAGEVTAAYGLIELAHAHIARLAVAGLAVAARLGESGIEIGGTPLELRGSSGPGPPMSGPRVDALSLSDARLTLETAEGTFEAAASASLALSGEDVRASDVSATIALPSDGTHRTVDFAVQSIVLERPADGGLRARVTQAAIAPQEPPWQARAIDGALSWLPDRIVAHLIVGELADSGQPMLVAPLRVNIDATLVGSRLDFAIEAEPRAKAAAKLEAKGYFDRSPNGGLARILVTPMVFRPAVLQPADLLPALAGTIEKVEGSVDLSGTLRWDGKVLAPDLALRLKDVGFTTPAARVHALNGTIRVINLWPPATPPHQALAATLEVSGLPAAQLRLEAQLTAKPALRFERIAIDFAGGEIAASPFSLDPAQPGLNTTLAITGVDLTELLKLLSIEGLSGTGRLNGHIPLRLESGKIAITAGRLAASAPGLLHYKPDKLPKEIAAAGEPVELMLQALGDFHYESLALELDKGTSGEGTILIRLKGSNPAVRSGQPFAFNIRVDSNFDRLADYVLLSLSSAQQLLRRAAGGAP